MSKNIHLLATLSAAVLAVTLSACTNPSAPVADPIDTPVDTPVGTGDWTPDEEWFAALDERTVWITDYVRFWDTQECTMDTVLEGDFNCNIHISGLMEGVTDLNDLLSNTINVTAEAADQVAGLEDATAAAAAGAPFAEQYDAGCAFSPDEPCIEIGDSLAASAHDLAAALDGWTRP